MRQHYAAVVDRDGDAFGISFPDFPGCVSAGRSAEEAIANGAEALAGHVAAMVDDGDPLPAPTPLAALPRPAADEDIVAITLVPVVIPGRAKRVNVTLDEGLLAEIDRLANNRSRFLSTAAREKIARERLAPVEIPIV